MARRTQFTPWNLAGRMSDQLESGDEVVRRAGWVFNTAAGGHFTLADFVDSGNHEVSPYLDAFGLRSSSTGTQTLVEIGAGIGRMTCAFSREFASVIACDSDSGFLERCYETVGRYGNVARLRTSHVADGRSLDVADGAADVTFSYLTMQHCNEQDALDLSTEAVRVTKPGGRIALNYRRPSTGDAVALPVAWATRAMFRVPAVGSLLNRSRLLTRIAWQASRLTPDQVTAQLGDSIQAATIWTNPAVELSSRDAQRCYYEGINPRHWWLVADVAG